MSLRISIDKCIEESIRELDAMEMECEIFVWPQTWSDASCGAGGLCSQAITTAPTVVVIASNNRACVYHGGRKAYTVDEINEEFRRAIDNKQLPGKMDSWKLQSIKANS